jgi:hypothetical protein
MRRMADHLSGQLTNDQDTGSDKRDCGQECADERIGGSRMKDHRVACQAAPDDDQPGDQKQQTATGDDQDDGGDDAEDAKGVGGPAFHGLKVLLLSLSVGDTDDGANEDSALNASVTTSKYREHHDIAERPVRQTCFSSILAAPGNAPLFFVVVLVFFSILIFHAVRRAPAKTSSFACAKRT